MTSSEIFQTSIKNEAIYPLGGDFSIKTWIELFLFKDLNLISNHFSNSMSNPYEVGFVVDFIKTLGGFEGFNILSYVVWFWTKSDDNRGDDYQKLLFDFWIKEAVLWNDIFLWF